MSDKTCHPSKKPKRNKEQETKDEITVISSDSDNSTGEQRRRKDNVIILDTNEMSDDDSEQQTFTSTTKKRKRSSKRELETGETADARIFFNDDKSKYERSFARHKIDKTQQTKESACNHGYVCDINFGSLTFTDYDRTNLNVATRDETVRKGPVGFESVQKGKNLTPELLRQLDTNLDTAAHEATVRKRFRRSESVHKGTNLTSESLGPRDTSLTVAAHDEPIRKRPRRCENVYETPELPSVTNEEQQQVFRFYWWDAYEDHLQQPGVVYLFGKVRADVPCCVAVREIPRIIYLLPRPLPVSTRDVYEEFSNEIAPTIKLQTFRSRAVRKKCAFDSAMPEEVECLEVRYSAARPGLRPTTRGRTFSKVLGTQTSFLEILLLDRRIKGPCWLDVVNPTLAKLKYSHCGLEVDCWSLGDLRVGSEALGEAPPLTAVTLNIITSVDPETRTNETVMVSCLQHTKYSVQQPPDDIYEEQFCVFTKPSYKNIPDDVYSFLGHHRGTRVQKCDSEKALWHYIVQKFEEIDPDIIIGHSLLDYYFAFICSRIGHCAVAEWSKLGRLKRKKIPTTKKEIKNLMAGRLVCDLKISARELIKAESYDLGSLLEQDEELRADVSNMFSSATALVQLMERTMADAVGMARIMHDLNIIPLALEMTKVAGNVMSRTLAGGHAERADYLLLHAFTENDYIAPEKHRDRPEGRVTLSGGLVLEPHAGLYRTFVLLLDFASLYPSIVREYTRTGVLSAEMTTLVESRREVKRRMTGELSARLLRQCDARQTALKLTANSIYGCLGHVHSRFYCPELASSITARGRDILLHTQTIIEEMNYRVIYGDTDSVMVDTNSMDYHAAVQIGNDIKDKVNTFYSKVELEIDGIYKSMLLLKKKKYAGIKVSKRNEEFILEREIKGLDIVRRDWSVLARDTANVALEQILSEEPLEHKITEIRALLEGTARDLKANNVPLRSLVIKKRLNKDPESYNVKNTAMPHVTVALRHNQLSGRPLLRGDVVPYLICEDGTARTALHRAYHISELAEAEHIRPDVGYYLTRQLYPVLSRLCEPLQGLDAAEVGRMLEVDAAQTPGRVANPVVQRLDAAIEKLAGGEFARCEPFSFKCHGCKTLIVVTPPKEAPFPLERCPGPGCQSKPYGLVDYIGNWLQSAVRRLSEKYYKATMVCEGALCPNRTACVPLRFRGPDPVCDVCNVGLLHSTFTERDMYTQLKFFRHVFDLSAVDKKPDNSQLTDAYRRLKSLSDKHLERSGYNSLRVASFFEDAQE